ncbi:MAG: hypothetical protein ACYC3S_15955 [Chloroflexota bacterium]
MSQELGKVERPEAAPFKLERKVYLVPLVLGPADPPADYKSLIARYWAGAGQHVARLEDRIGTVNHIYVELDDQAGEEGLKIAEQISAGAASVARGRVERGARFEALEDSETLAETMDWERCLLVGLASRKASEYVSEAYREASNRRYELMAKRLDATMGAGEAALAFLTEHHRLQFPENVRVFYVAPPALDEVHRWLRTYRERPQEHPPESPTREAGPAQGDTPGGEAG